MPGDYTLPRYGFSTQWLKFVVYHTGAGQSSRFKRPRPQPRTRRADVVSANQRQDYLWHHLEAASRAATAPASTAETVLTGTNQPVTVPTSKPAQSVESPALLKPVSFSTQAQPGMSTITITESTTIVTTSASSLTSAPRFTSY